MLAVSRAIEAKEEVGEGVFGSHDGYVVQAHELTSDHKPGRPDEQKVGHRGCPTRNMLQRTLQQHCNTHCNVGHRGCACGFGCAGVCFVFCVLCFVCV